MEETLPQGCNKQHLEKLTLGITCILKSPLGVAEMTSIEKLPAEPFTWITAMPSLPCTHSPSCTPHVFTTCSQSDVFQAQFDCIKPVSSRRILTTSN
uniref:Uncharacterized protein n=1 Tax=Canis lupus dingo TaxID=286419 RepID=A0A8C0KBR7_CANLU